MDNTFVWLINNFIWFSGLVAYYYTENVVYVFGVMGAANMIYMVIDDINKFFLK
ncbi:MAG: hypothetical protein WC307_05635 [Candidatus Nanoarchaeia archaeon]|jgi:hypothetical protein